MSTSEQSLREHIRKHYAYLVDELDVLMYMDLLYQEKVVSRQEKESLEEQRGRSEQARRFVDGLLRKPELSIRKFLGIVEGQKDKQPQIYETMFPELPEQQSRMPEREVPGRSQAIERSSGDRETSVVTAMDQGLYTFLRLLSTVYCNIDFL